MSEMKDDTREPIEDIEKTVEDLKKKIQEISADEGEEEDMDVDIPKFAETKTKINEIRENTVKTVNKSIDEVRKVATEAKDSEEMKKVVEYIRENAVKAVDLAKAKIEDLRSNPDLQKNLRNAQDKAGNVFDRITDNAREYGDKAGKYLNDRLSEEQKADLKEAADKAGKVLSDTAKKVSEAVDDLSENPKIQELGKNAQDLANKGVNAIKDLFEKKDKE